MKDELRLDRAFTNAPPEIHDAIEIAFMRGERAMKRRHKYTLALAAAASFAAMIAVGLAVGNAKPAPDAVAAPGVAAGAGEAAVYFTEGGNYYHAASDCSGMVGARAGSEREAWEMGKRPCPVCLSAGNAESAVPDETSEPEISAAESGEAEATLTPMPTYTPVPGEQPGGTGNDQAALPVYYTKNGTYYHGAEHCSGMRNAERHPLTEAEAAGKRRCPECRPGGVPERYELFLSAFGQDLSALYPGYVYAYTGEGWFGADGWVMQRVGQEDPEQYIAVQVKEDSDGVTLEVDTERVVDLDGCMANALSPVRDMYEATLAQAARRADSEDGGLDRACCTRMTLAFDGEGRLEAFEMNLEGDRRSCHARWERFEDEYRMVSFFDPERVEEGPAPEDLPAVVAEGVGEA